MDEGIIDPGWTLKFEYVVIDGDYRLGINNGVVVTMVTEGERPTVTIGGDMPREVQWRENLGMCVWLDTYIVSNCQLHTNHPTRVTLIKLFPVKPV